jgi:hypothetical protein
MVCACREGKQQCSWWITREFNGQLKSYCANPNIPIQAKIICDGNQPQFIAKWEAGTIKVLIQGDAVKSIAGEQNRSSEPNVISMSEISQKNIAAVAEPKESSKPNTAQEQTIVNFSNMPISENQIKPHRTNASTGPESIDPEIPSTMARQNEFPKSDIIKELETNLAIATMPWLDKLLSFQTICWDAKRGESEQLLTSCSEELMQLYSDTGLANNIVWLATEIGHRSKELDESYIKLCTSIAERIKKIKSFVDVNA